MFVIIFLSDKNKRFFLRTQGNRNIYSSITDTDRRNEMRFRMELLRNRTTFLYLLILLSGLSTIISNAYAMVTFAAFTVSSIETIVQSFRRSCFHLSLTFASWAKRTFAFLSGCSSAPARRLRSPSALSFSTSPSAVCCFGSCSAPAWRVSVSPNSASPFCEPFIQ